LAADPTKAPAMQAYMKSAMPFLGVPAPERRRCVRRALDATPLDPSAWREPVLELWRDATHREERYAALDLAHRFRRNAGAADMPLYEELVVTGAWWDYVDPVAGLIGTLLRRDPGTIRPAMLRWSRDADVWKRRVSIISQLGRQDETDLDLLYGCIEASIDRPEFFLRKAIGWALRDLARSNPAEVDRYVRANAGRLSPLSRREATKHLARLMA
jgi:3-methyladenine DNA glycosylase AlkD